MTKKTPRFRFTQSHSNLMEIGGLVTYDLIEDLVDSTHRMRLGSWKDDYGSGGTEYSCTCGFRTSEIYSSPYPGVPKDKLKKAKKPVFDTQHKKMRKALFDWYKSDEPKPPSIENP